MSPREAVNSALDQLVRPAIPVPCGSWSAFKVCGYTGLALAVLLAMTLVTRVGLSPWVMTGIVLSAVATFFGLAAASKIIAGEERLVYYHHELAVLGVTATLLWLLGQPVLPYLDVTILGIGAFLVFGRLGCLMVGCCHGRPHAWGVRYRAEHAAAGFPAYLVGIRLLPVQAMESLSVLLIVITGCAMILSGRAPGTALTWYVIAYGVVRFALEFLRGDPARPYRWGFSEAQWFSLFLSGAAVGAELIGFLSFHPWHAAATAGLAATAIAVALGRRWRGVGDQLLSPRHVKEVVDAVAQVSDLATEWTGSAAQPAPPITMYVGCTSLGVQVSAGKVMSPTGYLYHYALSCQNGAMTEETAAALGGVIRQFKHATTAHELIRGDGGVFHIVIHPPRSKDQALT